MVAMSPGLSAALGAILPSDALVRDEAELRHYGTDRCRGDWPVAPCGIAFVRDVAQIQAVVRACAEHGVSVVPSGGRTGLAGAATATQGELVLSLARMTRILEVDASAGFLRCEAGTTIEAVRTAAAEVGLTYPIVFAAQGSAQVGGTIATNAGGVNVLRYGMTREWVMALRVVLASGEVLETGRPLVKNNTGYDLCRMFVGSEGTLGVIAEATLRLCRPPAGRIVALCALADETALLELLVRVRGAGLDCSAFECFDADCVAYVLAARGGGSPPFSPIPRQHALVELELARPGVAARSAAAEELTDLLARAQDDGVIADAVVAASSAQETALWAWRDDISEALHRHSPHKADVSLPLSRVPAFVVAWRDRAALALPGVPALCFGHIGDGNLHLNLLCPPEVAPPVFAASCRSFDDEVYALVGEMSGSISAEHGIGLLKRAHLHHSRSPLELELMRAIKRAVDPQGLLNPGKVF